MKKLLKIALLLCAVSAPSKTSAMSRAEIDTLLNPRRSAEIYHLLNPEFQLQFNNHINLANQHARSLEQAVHRQGLHIRQLQDNLEQECAVTRLYQSQVEHHQHMIRQLAWLVGTQTAAGFAMQERIRAQQNEIDRLRSEAQQRSAMIRQHISQVRQILRPAAEPLEANQSPSTSPRRSWFSDRIFYAGVGLLWAGAVGFIAYNAYTTHQQHQAYQQKLQAWQQRLQAHTAALKPKYKA